VDIMTAELCTDINTQVISLIYNAGLDTQADIIHSRQFNTHNTVTDRQTKR